MAIVRKSLTQISSEIADVDLRKLRATTDDEIRRHVIEDGENPASATISPLFYRR